MKKERVFWGVLFILAGISLIINKLGYFQDVNILNLLLTVFLVAVIIKSIFRLNFAGILFPIAIIGIIYDEQLGITDVTPWTLLIAALFASIGLSLIFNRHGKCNRNKCDNDEYKFTKIDVQDQSHIEFRNSFAATTKYINTDKFEQADFSCSLGAMKIYFDNAIMSSDHATVSINASLSGIELYIPKSWKVENKVHTFAATIEEKNISNQEATNTLTLVGDINFSGIEIIYI